MLFLIGLSIFALAGCKNKDQEPAAHAEEPYTPPYASLDSMDAAPPSEPVVASERPIAEVAADTEPPVSVASEPDELLAPVGGQVYTVQKGDTLYKLARRFYSDQARWRDIWDANKTRLPDPDKLQIGMKLIIP